MKPRAHNPRRLDVAVFAEAEAALQGESPLSAFARLAASTVAPPPGQALPAVAWRIEGHVARRAGRVVERRLAVSARTRAWLQCQRCLEPVAADVAVARSAAFVEGEDAAAALDAQSDDDVLALSAAFDALEWLEDELLLGLPLVPRHTDCSAPAGTGDASTVPGGTAGEAGPEAPAHPFAALAALKGKKAL